MPSTVSLARPLAAEATADFNASRLRAALSPLKRLKKGETSMDIYGWNDR